MSTRLRLAALAVAALTGASALAQSTPTLPPVEPYWATVAIDDASMHCGPGDIMYPVLKLQRGQLLRVDAEGPDAKGKLWSRVAYPTGSFVYLAADAVQTEPAGKTAGLTKPAIPKAPNLTNGLRGSWYPALPDGLRPGAKVVIVGPELAADGTISSYKILPPDDARAFAPSAALRRATPEEIAAAAGSTIPLAPAPGQQQASSPTRPVPQTGGPTDLTTPLTPGTGQAPSAPAPTETASVPQPEPVTIEQKPREPSPYERLELALAAMRQQPFDDAEYTALLGEYQAELAKLENSPTNRTLRARISQRIEFLKLQTDVQAARQALAESEATIGINEQKIAERLAEVDRSRMYTVVGRLSASTLYDGKRLPLMYRVQAVGGPRTLAYVKPDEKLAIAAKLGQVVGLIGESRMDPTLKANVITPVRIDALEAAAVADVPTDTPASEQ